MAFELGCDEEKFIDMNEVVKSLSLLRKGDVVIIDEGQYYHQPPESFGRHRMRLSSTWIGLGLNEIMENSPGTVELFFGELYEEWSFSIPKSDVKELRKRGYSLSDGIKNTPDCELRLLTKSRDPIFNCVRLYRQYSQDFGDPRPVEGLIIGLIYPTKTENVDGRKYVTLGHNERTIYTNVPDSTSIGDKFHKGLNSSYAHQLKARHLSAPILVTRR